MPHLQTKTPQQQTNTPQQQTKTPQQQNSGIFVHYQQEAASRAAASREQFSASFAVKPATTVRQHASVLKRIPRISSPLEQVRICHLNLSSELT